MWKHHNYVSAYLFFRANSLLLQKEHKAIMNFLVILDGALIVVLLGFNAWSWFLASAGLSTLEFM